MCFYYSQNLKEVVIPNVKSIVEACFAHCSNLTYVRLDNIESLNMGIFSHCKSLERVDGLSLCKEVGPCCFEHSGIKELDLRRCFDIGHSAFLDSGLRKIKLSGNLYRSKCI